MRLLRAGGDALILLAVFAAGFDLGTGYVNEGRFAPLALAETWAILHAPSLGAVQALAADAGPQMLAALRFALAQSTFALFAVPGLTLRAAAFGLAILRSARARP